MVAPTKDAFHEHTWADVKPTHPCRPLAVSMARGWLDAANALDSDDPAEMQEMNRVRLLIQDIYNRRWVAWQSADCTCRPDSVTACAWCRTPAHIKAAYTV